jgi:hypothetical protein
MIIRTIAGNKNTNMIIQTIAGNKNTNETERTQHKTCNLQTGPTTGHEIKTKNYGTH